MENIINSEVPSIMPNLTLILNNCNKMPLVGHGLWKIPNEKTADHVYNAIKAGYRLFDVARGESAH
jgi:D-xylose reductase